MIEVLWQYDILTKSREPAPATAFEALQALNDGNSNFSALLQNAESGISDVHRVVHLSTSDLGLTTAANRYPEQAPFALVLGCSDARVPVEMVFWQEANDLFVVRVAGNSPGMHVWGSIGYAVTHLKSVKLLVVLGHTGCGAVTAAVDAFLQPAISMGITADMPVRAIIDGIMAAVGGSAYALEEFHGASVRRAPGYRDALIELSVIMHTALTAAAVWRKFADDLGPELGVVFGVFNLSNHAVGLPDGAAGNGVWRAGLQEPRMEASLFAEWVRQMTQSSFILERLGL